MLSHIKIHTHFPRTDDMIEALSEAEWFSTLDLKSGYWQVPLDDAAKDKTEFSTTGSGLWQFRVMPVTLCNIPATFEQLMEQVLIGLSLSMALVYLNNITVAGCIFPQPISNPHLVFERLKLKLPPKKCILF